MAGTVDAKRAKEYTEDPLHLERKLDKLAKMVRASNYTVFFTGAGVSTSAGISDYRGPSGAWTQRHIRKLQSLGDKMTDEERIELAKLVENRDLEQSKQKLEKSTVYLPLMYNGEQAFEKCDGDAWRLKDAKQFTTKPKICGVAYRRSKTNKMGHVLGEGLRFGSFAPASANDEGDGWLRCEVALKEAKAGAMPTLAHMAQVTLIRKGFAKYVVTTNLDGLYRKAGLKVPEEVCFLHGDTYTERCTSCGYDFERNFPVRNKGLHVHDHHVGTCSKCGSKAPAEYTGSQGNKTGADAQNGFKDSHLIGSCDKDVGTKDTHINFGEYLDDKDLEEASEHCLKADLCIVMGTSMSLRHITHFPFQARKTVIVNLQEVPDDTNENKHKISLRLWAQCDTVCEGLLRRLNLVLESVPQWRPRDPLPPEQLPSRLSDIHRREAIMVWELEKTFRSSENIPPATEKAKILEEAKVTKLL